MVEGQSPQAMLIRSMLFSPTPFKNHSSREGSTPPLLLAAGDSDPFSVRSLLSHPRPQIKIKPHLFLFKLFVWNVSDSQDNPTPVRLDTKYQSVLDVKGFSSGRDNFLAALTEKQVFLYKCK